MGIKLEEKLILQIRCLVLSLTAMPGASSPVGPTKKTTRKQMLFMQLWTKGWMKEEKKEGKTSYCPSLSLSDSERKCCLNYVRLGEKLQEQCVCLVSFEPLGLGLVAALR